MPSKATAPVTGLLSIQSDAGAANRIHIELNRIQELKGYHAVECSLVFYPYSDRIGAKDYTVLPFENYVKDIAKNHRSAYSRIKSNAKEIFGMVLGTIVFLFVLKYTHTDVITMESLIGIFASYFIGKDLWDDIEQFVYDRTRESRLQYRESDYRYRLDKNSTLFSFNAFARRQQHHKEALYPERMDFVMRSQSSTTRLGFTSTEFANISSDSAHLLSIEIEEKKMPELRKKGYLLGMKITLQRRFLLFNRNIDFYQTYDNGRVGCLGDHGEWRKDTVFTREHLTMGKLRFTMKTGYSERTHIIV